jgi:hypothetical protein
MVGLPPDHPYEYDGSRTHELVVARLASRYSDAPHEISIVSTAKLRADGGEDLSEPPHVEGELDGDGVLTRVPPLTSAELRELGRFLKRSLTLAAVRLEAIERGTR